MVNAAHVETHLTSLTITTMIITNLVSPRAADCFCSGENITALLDIVDKVLCKIGTRYEKSKKYDLKDSPSIEEMSRLLSYKRMFLSKLESCSGCFSNHNIQEIKSKLLTLLYR